MSKGEDGATNGYDDQNLPDDWQSQLRQLVLAYLVHNCYQETAMCFSASVNNFPKTGDGSSGVTTTTKSTSVTTDQLADKASASTSQASLNEGNDVSTAEAAKTTVAKMEIETRDDGMLESLSHRKRK
jgi:hypothetical protein